MQLGPIESVGSMLYSREIARIAQIQRLRQDLGLNLIGAAMVLDLAQEVAQLRAQLEVCRSGSLNTLATSVFCRHSNSGTNLFRNLTHSLKG